MKPKGRAKTNQLGDRLILHSIRDSHGRVLGLGAPMVMDHGDEDENTDHEARGWEAFMEAQTAHDGAVTGIDTVGGFGDLGGVSGVATSGGDGWGEIDGREMRPLKPILILNIIYILGTVYCYSPLRETTVGPRYVDVWWFASSKPSLYY